MPRARLLSLALVVLGGVLLAVGAGLVLAVAGGWVLGVGGGAAVLGGELLAAGLLLVPQDADRRRGAGL